MKAVKLSDLLDSLHFNSPEASFFVDLQTGRVEMVTEMVLRTVEDEDEEEETLDEDPDWQDEEFALAKAIAADSGERFLPAPSPFDFHEYRHMERFIGDLEDDRAAEELWRAIRGRGAFRCFKDTAHRLGLLDRWFSYRDSAMEKFVRDWAEANKVPVVENTRTDSRD